MVKNVYIILIPSVEFQANEVKTIFVVVSQLQNANNLFSWRSYQIIF